MPATLDDDPIDLGHADETAVPDAAPAAGVIGLWEFFSEAFIPMERIQIPLKPVHRRICDEMEKALLGQYAGKYWFYVFNMPPRIGKTKIMEAAVCWMYGLFPESHWIYTSYSNPLAAESCRYVQKVMNAEWYRILFPNFRFGAMEQADNFNTNRNGRFKADGVKAMLTGFGGGLKQPAGGGIVIDDPANPTEALSKIEVEALQFWLENVIMRRRNQDIYCPIFLVCQRLGGEDLAGYVLKNYPERTLHLKFAGLETDAQGREFSAFPETTTIETLQKMRATNKYAFSAQIQQEPMVMGGNMIRVEEFGYFTPNEALQYDWLALYSDTAWKTRQSNDWSVVLVAGRIAGKCHVLDVVRGKWESPDLLANIRQLWESWKGEAARRRCWLRKLVMEDHASGTAVIQALRREGIAVEAVVRTKDKATRVEEVLPFIASHQVLLAKDAPWLNDFLDECASFRKDGKHAHDDMVDALADAIKGTLGSPLTIFDVMGRRKIR